MNATQTRQQLTEALHATFATGDTEAAAAIREQLAALPTEAKAPNFKEQAAAHKRRR